MPHNEADRDTCSVEAGGADVFLEASLLLLLIIARRSSLTPCDGRAARFSSSSDATVKVTPPSGYFVPQLDGC